MKSSPLIIAAALICLPIFSSHADSDEYKLVLWNQHNGTNNDRGTKTCKIEALKNGAVVWTQEKLGLPWHPNKDDKAAVVIPAQLDRIDEIRVTITEWIGSGGGLAEVEVYKNDKNITTVCKVSVSASLDDRFTADKLVDGVTTSAATYSGYWLLPDNTSGDVDIKLPAGNLPESRNTCPGNEAKPGKGFGTLERREIAKYTTDTSPG